MTKILKTSRGEVTLTALDQRLLDEEVCCPRCQSPVTLVAAELDWDPEQEDPHDGSVSCQEHWQLDYACPSCQETAQRRVERGAPHQMWP